MAEPATKSGVCPPSEALAGIGPMLVLTELDVLLLTAFFDRALDEASCEACGLSLGVRPTLVFAATSPDGIYFSIGSMAEQTAATS
jgi:hypothetical protein